MFSIKMRDLIYNARHNPKKLGYLANCWVVIDFLDEETRKPQRAETLECKLLLELTEGCPRV